MHKNLSVQMIGMSSNCIVYVKYMQLYMCWCTSSCEFAMFEHMLYIYIYVCSIHRMFHECIHALFALCVDDTIFQWVLCASKSYTILYFKIHISVSSFFVTIFKLAKCFTEDIILNVFCRKPILIESISMNNFVSISNHNNF